MNLVVVGRAGTDEPVAEGSDMRSHLADLHEFFARAATDGTPDAEPEPAGVGPAFGPCQDHLAAPDDDRDQIDRRRWKGRA